MTNKPFSQISSKELHTNPYWDLFFDEYRLSDNSIGNYYYVNSRGSTMVIPVFDSSTFLLVNQFRYLNQLDSIEFPGGGIEVGLTPEENAIKELEEETGYTSSSLKYIGKFNPYKGVTNEICYVFLASNLSKVSAKPEKTEQISLLSLNEVEIINLIKSNKIWDGMSITSWHLYQLTK
jgi:ADP-ribose pyrophosphatase